MRPRNDSIDDDVYSSPVHADMPRHSGAKITFSDVRRMLFISAVCFMIAILIIMSKLQVSAQDIFRWAPVIWLLGIIVAGTIMNFVMQCAVMLAQKRRARRLNSTDIASILNSFPRSYSCILLAPSSHSNCCAELATLSGSKESLPTYDDIFSKDVEAQPPSYDSLPIAGSWPGRAQRQAPTSRCLDSSQPPTTTTSSVDETGQPSQPHSDVDDV